MKMKPLKNALRSFDDVMLDFADRNILGGGFSEGNRFDAIEVSALYFTRANAPFFFNSS